MRRSIDGRWICVLGLTAYLAWLLSGGPWSEYRERWRQLGVDAKSLTFVDLYVFPAARNELAAGRDPSRLNPTDPLSRPYNYPRAWLAFMRFPANATAIDAVGVAMAFGALFAILLCWGRLTFAQGAMAGFLVCTPAIMLGVERGNSDEFVFCLVAAGILLPSATGKIWEIVAQAFWLAASVLKLYPALAFAALCHRPWGAAWRRIVVPAVVFALYLIVFREEVRATLRATGSGWILSYGAQVPAKALAQVLGYYYGIAIDGVLLSRGSITLALALGCLAASHGRRLSRAAFQTSGFAPIRWRGFQVGGVIYLGTFLASDNFDYRQIFLLLVMPALWDLTRAPKPVAKLARVGLIGLAFSMAVNYFNAGWPGFVLNELGGWSLVYVLTALLVADLLHAGKPISSRHPVYDNP